MNFVLGTSATYEDNLFRLASDRAVPVAGKTSRSDMIYTAFAGVRFDKTYSLQRFQVDMTATRYQYRTYDYLNFTAVDYRAAWLWSLTPRLTGTVSADRSEAQTSYADFTSPDARNVQTRQNRSLTADWWVGGAWHLIGGAHQARLDNTANFSEVGNYVQDTAEAGVKYVSPAANSIAAVYRESQGEYRGRTLGDGSLLDTGYDQRETELRAFWRTSGHSSLDARLGYLDRKHDHYSQRDYSGAVGRLSYLWTPTGKLQFTVATGRDLFSYQNNSSSYYTYDYVTLIPVWNASDKTSVRLKLDIGTRDYHGAIVGASNRSDDIYTTQLGLTWRPTRTIDVDGHLTREQRSSSVAGRDYHANIAGISAVLKF